MRGRIMYHCETCGQLFSAPASQRSRHFCSHACYHRKHPLHGTPEQRFWSKVQKTEGCWLWQGATKSSGYGCFTVTDPETRQKRTLIAPRFSYVLRYGEIPDGLFVLHRCDVPACVNPEHLFLGTHADNMADAAMKNRNVFGARHSRSKLSEDQVREIRRRAAAGETHRALAAEFGVWHDHITRIVQRIWWRRLV